jgi:SAM-dependent methyltransferase
LHPNSLLLFERYALPHLRAGMNVLEIGPDRIPSSFRSRAGGDVASWDTLDLAPRTGLTHTASDEYSFPIAADNYDVVLSAQVIEHVRRIWVWIEEIARVCKPGGRVITIAPLSWPYHEAPVDCWRIYPEGMRALYEQAGLQVDLCVLDSLEAEGIPRPVAGGSAKPTNSRHPGRYLRKLAGRLGWPTPCSYDTVTIGTKPGS